MRGHLKVKREDMTTKRNMREDTVLRRGYDGTLFLMDKQEGGWVVGSIVIENEQWLLDHYQVRLGEWTKDVHGECCPVICVPRSEQPTLHEGLKSPVPTEPAFEEVEEEFFRAGKSLSDANELASMEERSEEVTRPYSMTFFGGDHTIPDVKAGSLSAFKAEMSELGFQFEFVEDNGPVSQAWGKALYESGALEDQCFTGDQLSSGMREFISSHPGVRLGMGPSCFVALMPDGVALALSPDGAILPEEAIIN